MVSSIIFDLDETLISTFYRQFKVIKDFCLKKQLDFYYDFDDYINLRSLNQSNNFEFYSLNVKVKKFDKEFKEFYLKNIESFHYLNLDRLIINLELFREFKEKSNFKFHILSLRSNPLNGKKQLDSLGISKYIDCSYFAKHDNSVNPKTVILKEIKGKSKIIYFVGDSKTDMEASQKNNIEFVKVNSNIIDFEFSGKRYNDINNFLINHLG
jgi:phosphoglycolate phosphatase-like HAD superfamily hydrolase